MVTNAHLDVTCVSKTSNCFPNTEGIVSAVDKSTVTYSPSKADLFLGTMPPCSSLSDHNFVQSDYSLGSSSPLPPSSAYFSVALGGESLMTNIELSKTTSLEAVTSCDKVNSENEELPGFISDFILSATEEFSSMDRLTDSNPTSTPESGISQACRHEAMISSESSSSSPSLSNKLFKDNSPLLSSTDTVVSSDLLSPFDHSTDLCSSLKSLLAVSSSMSLGRPVSEVLSSRKSDIVPILSFNERDLSNRTGIVAVKRTNVNSLTSLSNIGNIRLTTHASRRTGNNYRLPRNLSKVCFDSDVSDCQPRKSSNRLCSSYKSLLTGDIAMRVHAVKSRKGVSSLNNTNNSSIVQPKFCIQGGQSYHPLMEHDYASLILSSTSEVQHLKIDHPMVLSDKVKRCSIVKSLTSSNSKRRTVAHSRNINLHETLTSSTLHEKAPSSLSPKLQPLSKKQQKAKNSHIKKVDKTKKVKSVATASTNDATVISAFSSVHNSMHNQSPNSTPPYALDFDKIPWITSNYNQSLHSNGVCERKCFGRKRRFPRTHLSVNFLAKSLPDEIQSLDGKKDLDLVSVDDKDEILRQIEARRKPLRNVYAKERRSYRKRKLTDNTDSDVHGSTDSYIKMSNFAYYCQAFMKPLSSSCALSPDSNHSAEAKDVSSPHVSQFPISLSDANVHVPQDGNFYDNHSKNYILIRPSSVEDYLSMVSYSRAYIAMVWTYYEDTNIDLRELEEDVHAPLSPMALDELDQLESLYKVYENGDTSDELVNVDMLVPSLCESTSSACDAISLPFNCDRTGGGFSLAGAEDGGVSFESSVLPFGDNIAALQSASESSGVHSLLQDSKETFTSDSFTEKGEFLSPHLRMDFTPPCTNFSAGFDIVDYCAVDVAESCGLNHPGPYVQVLWQPVMTNPVSPMTYDILSPPASSAPEYDDPVEPASEELVSDRSEPPELCIINMFWNDLPGFLHDGRKWVRLIDIHKQILLDKDTRVLKTRCESLGWEVKVCTDMQRDFLVRYAQSHGSKSPYIVEKSIAENLIQYYVQPGQHSRKVDDKSTVSRKTGIVSPLGSSLKRTSVTPSQNKIAVCPPETWSGDVKKVKKCGRPSKLFNQRRRRTSTHNSGGESDSEDIEEHGSILPNRVIPIADKTTALESEVIECNRESENVIALKKHDLRTPSSRKSVSWDEYVGLSAKNFPYSVGKSNKLSLDDSPRNKSINEKNSREAKMGMSQHSPSLQITPPLRRNEYRKNKFRKACGA